MESRLDQVNHYLDGSLAVMRQVAESCGSEIVAVADAITSALNDGNKVLLCGNGGSAADCQHMASELVSGLARDSDRPGLSAIALTTDTSFLTARANDHGFDEIFERQVQVLGRRGDVLIAISTSGRSENVLRAVRSARGKGMTTVGFVGADGPLAVEVDYAVVIPDHDTQHVQEALLPVEHAVCSLVEQAVLARGQTLVDQ